MQRKIFKTGNSIVVSLPQEYLDYLGVEQGSEISLELDRENRQLVITPIASSLVEVGIDEGFAHQIDDFIDKYRPALEKLAKS